MSAPTARPAGPVSVPVPEGYLTMPLADPATAIRDAGELLAAVSEPTTRRMIDDTLQTLGVLLGDLGTAGGRYCGYGRHASVDTGEPVTSVLVVSELQFPDGGDPDAILELLGDADDVAGDGAREVFRTDVGRAVSVRERVRTLPAPTVPGAEPPPVPSAAVYQLEALVPSFDGTRLAKIELSTPSVADGPSYRVMVMSMAIAASFGDEPADG